MEDNTSGQEFEEVMRLLTQLHAEDDLPGGVRVIFTPKQKGVARQLLDQYEGTTSSGAMARTTQDMLRQARSLLTQVQVRDRDVGFLEQSERETVTRLLRPNRKSRRHLRLTRRQKIAAALAVVALLLAPFGVRLAHDALTTQSAPPVVNEGPPAANVPPLTSTDLHKTLTLFGPWETIAPTDQRPDSHQPAVLMLKQNGGTIASQRWTIPFDLGVWERQDSTDIDKLSVVGTYIRLGTTTQRSFIVHVDQPFIFEQTPGQVYLVDEAGHVWYVTLAQATGLRRPLH